MVIVLPFSDIGYKPFIISSIFHKVVEIVSSMPIWILIHKETLKILNY